VFPGREACAPLPHKRIAFDTQGTGIFGEGSMADDEGVKKADLRVQYIIKASRRRGSGPWPATTCWARHMSQVDADLAPGAW